LLAIAISAALGILLGGFAGVGRTATRQILMRAVDVILSFPVLLLAMVFLAITKPSLGSVAIIIGLGWGAYLARIVFGIVHSLAARDLTASAVAIGASRRRILFRHLLPHALPAVIVYVTLGVGVAIQAEAVFGYLGVGLPPPDASWGNMVAEGQGFFITQPRLVFVPAGAILAAMLAFVLLGDGLRHALDPKHAGRGAALETRRA
jgi:peptide/nickel transport system permease protein